MTTEQPTGTAERSPAESTERAFCRPVRVMPVSDTERKLATVMFIDLKGSTDLSRSIELEEWWEVLSELFELMCASVYRFGGWIGNFTGDGIKAVFEDADAAEHARRGCDAALWFRDSVRSLDRSCNHELQVRIGLSSGEILTGTIGDSRSHYYTASGYTVHLAKRMETMAQPGRIYVAECTAALAKGAHELRDLGPFEVKGACAPVGVYELLRRGWFS